MIIVTKYTLDLTRKSFQQYVHATQNDSNTRAVEITLLANGEPWSVPAGVIGSVSFKKPDKTGGVYDTLPDGTTQAVKIQDNKVTAVLAPQVLTVPGDTQVNVSLHDVSLNRLNTFPFVLRVDGDPAAGTTVSEDYYWVKTLAAVGDLSKLSTTAKSSLVEAINELYSRGSSGGGGSGQNLTLDTTLTQGGKAADAKATGDEIKRVEGLIPSIDGLAKSEDIPTKPEDIGAQPKGDYLTKAPVTSVNGFTGAVTLTAADVGAMSTSEANGIITNLLDEAKKSGEFDGGPGADGRGIKSIARTAGNGAAGTVDTYTITYTDDTTSTYQVRNGANGGKGDDGNGIRSVVLNADYTLTLEFDDGSTYTTPSIRGEAGAPGAPGKDGSDGEDGADGADGVGISKMEQTTASSEDGGSNVFKFTLTNGNAATFTVKNGSTGGTGERGTGILKISTAPSSYTTETGGFTPTYRIALSTVLTQSKAAKVLVGDQLAYSYYQYPVGYVDDSYVYLGTRQNMRGATGSTGEQGPQGPAYTLTDEDKAAITAAVIAALPKYAGEVS